MGFDWYHNEIERNQESAKQRVLASANTEEMLIALADEHDNMNHWEWSRMVLAALLMFKDEADGA